MPMGFRAFGFRDGRRQNIIGSAWGLSREHACILGLQQEPVLFFCWLVFFVVGSLKDEPGRPVSE